MRKGDTLKGDSICDFLFGSDCKRICLLRVWYSRRKNHTLHMFKTIICCKRREILMFKNLFSTTVIIVRVPSIKIPVFFVQRRAEIDRHRK